VPFLVDYPTFLKTSILLGFSRFDKNIEVLSVTKDNAICDATHVIDIWGIQNGGEGQDSGRMDRTPHKRSWSESDTSAVLSVTTERKELVTEYTSA
jgi:hypothetical protein